jgi:hypothetical protein
MESNPDIRLFQENRKDWKPQGSRGKVRRLPFSGRNIGLKQYIN